MASGMRHGRDGEWWDARRAMAVGRAGRAGRGRVLRERRSMRATDRPGKTGDVRILYQPRHSGEKANQPAGYAMPRSRSLMCAKVSLGITMSDVLSSRTP